MLFGVPKFDGSTRLILNLSDKTMFNYSINNLIDPKLCTVEHAKKKQVVETVRASSCHSCHANFLCGSVEIF